MLARFVFKVFDEIDIAADASEADLEWTEEIVQPESRRRKQVKLLIGRSRGRVRRIDIEEVISVRGENRLERVLRLDERAAARLMELVRAVEHVPIEATGETVRLDEATLKELAADPGAIARLFRRAPAEFREFVRNDAAAEEVIALARRKQVVEKFRRLLAEPEEFERARLACGGSKEKVWQRFLEENPWILGVGLAGQLLRSWDDERLEQIVAGPSVAGAGKRTDALLRTTGLIRSLVFAEIKHHETELLEKEYRTGCWAPSPDLAGGVVQTQQTVDRAVRAIGTRLADRDEDGAETGEATWLIRPRSFLIAGHLQQLRGQGGVHADKHRSFELFRRNLYEPEVMTFDELLARAEWHVEIAEQEQPRGEREAKRTPIAGIDSHSGDDEIPF